MAKTKKTKRSFSSFRRMFRAYRTTLIVLGSYIRLWLLSKILGRGYFKKRLTPLHIRNAKRIKKAILELEGLFIKVGQLISIMTHFLPKEFRGPLETLQDKVPARPIEEIRRRIEQELGALPSELFRHFEEIPLASASLGQVHRARLKEGQEVAIKVQHLNIEKIAQLDLNIIERIIRIVSPFAGVKGLSNVYEQIRKMIEEELDFVREAESMQQIGENLKEDSGVQVPEVLEQYSTKRVLTTVFWEGSKITNNEQLENWKLNRTEIANRLLRIYCQMVFLDGLYHADPHPGNILVTEDGTIVLLDFGAVATLSSRMKNGIPELIKAVTKNDKEAIVKALRTIGFIGKGKETEKMAEKLVEAFNDFLNDELQLEGLNFKDIKLDPEQLVMETLRFKLNIQSLSSAIQIPKEVVLLARMVVLLDGVCASLDPSLNPLLVIRPYLQEFALGKEGSLTSLLLNAVKNTLTLPEDLRQFLKKARRGELEIAVHGMNDNANLLYALGHQMICAFFVVAAAGAAYLFQHEGDIEAFKISLGVGGLFAFFLAVSMASAKKYRN